MKLKNFLLGASLAMCGAAFGQTAAYQVYVPDYHVTLYATTCDVSEDTDGNTEVLLDVISTVDGDPTHPVGRPYLGHPGGYTGSWGPRSLIICSERPSQCVWINNL